MIIRQFLPRCQPKRLEYFGDISLTKATFWKCLKKTFIRTQSTIALQVVFEYFLNEYLSYVAVFFLHFFAMILFKENTSKAWMGYLLIFKVRSSQEWIMIFFVILSIYLLVHVMNRVNSPAHLVS